jgi:spermidine/putrescine transport system permease protein
MTIDPRPARLMAPALSVIFLLLIVPVGFIVVYSFWLRTATGADHAAFSFSNWHDVLTDPFYRHFLLQTLRIAFITTITCILLGYVPAYFIATTKFRHKSLLLLLLMLPFWISYIIRTMSWIHVLGSTGALNVFLMWTGVINQPLDLLYNQGSVILGLVQYLLPFMILNVYVSLESIDTNLISAARSLGCTSLEAFREVTLPLSVPGLAAGSLLCFVLAGGTYITPLILGGPRDAMFANLVFDAIITQLNWPLGSVLSLVLLIVLGAVVMLYNYFIGIGQLAKAFR